MNKSRFVRKLLPMRVRAVGPEPAPFGLVRRQRRGDRPFCDRFDKCEPPPKVHNEQLPGFKACRFSRCRRG